jgi:hypothetical protein
MTRVKGATSGNERAMGTLGGTNADDTSQRRDQRQRKQRWERVAVPTPMTRVKGATSGNESNGDAWRYQRR